MKRSPNEARVERRYRGRIVNMFGKKHRIVSNKLLMNAYPQWKGLFFWHTYKSYSIDTNMGNLLVTYQLAQDPVFFQLYADAQKFLLAAMAQEKNGGKRGEYYEDPETGK